MYRMTFSEKTSDGLSTMVTCWMHKEEAVDKLRKLGSSPKIKVTAIETIINVTETFLKETSK